MIETIERLTSWVLTCFYGIRSPRNPLISRSNGNCFLVASNTWPTPEPFKTSICTHSGGSRSHGRIGPRAFPGPATHSGTTSTTTCCGSSGGTARTSASPRTSSCAAAVRCGKTCTPPRGAKRRLCPPTICSSPAAWTLPTSSSTRTRPGAAGSGVRFYRASRNIRCGSMNLQSSGIWISSCGDFKRRVVAAIVQ